MISKQILNERNAKLLIRVLIGVIFILSGITKILRSDMIIAQLNKILPFGNETSIIIACCISLIEVVIGVFILFKPSRFIFYTSMSALSFFCLFLVYKVITHDQSVCGCFGNFIKASNEQELLNDLVLIAANIYVKDTYNPVC